MRGAADSRRETTREAAETTLKRRGSGPRPSRGLRACRSGSGERALVRVGVGEALEEGRRMPLWPSPRFEDAEMAVVSQRSTSTSSDRLPAADPRRFSVVSAASLVVSARIRGATRSAAFRCSARGGAPGESASGGQTPASPLSAGRPCRCVCGRRAWAAGNARGVHSSHER